jgi:hypothetical protein
LPPTKTLLWSPHNSPPDNDSQSAVDPGGGELLSPSHTFHHPPGRVPLGNGLSGPVQAPPNPIKARPPNDQQPLHQLRSLAISISSSRPSSILQQTHLDHSGGRNPGGPISEQHHPGGVDGNMSAIHHGLQYPQQHDGGYGAQSNVGTLKPAELGQLGDGQLMGGGGTTTRPPERRPPIRAAQVH